MWLWTWMRMAVSAVCARQVRAVVVSAGVVSAGTVPTTTTTTTHLSCNLVTLRNLVTEKIGHMRQQMRPRLPVKMPLTRTWDPHRIPLSVGSLLYGIPLSDGSLKHEAYYH